MIVLEARGLHIPDPAGGLSHLPGPIEMTLVESDVLALLGPSGSGKSTLLRCLAFLEARARGSIYFRGTRVHGSSVPSFRRQVVYVPQTPPRFPMSVLDSMRHAFRFHTSESEFEESRAFALCERLALPEKILERDLQRVSGGEAQRLAMVRALLLAPSVLLLDEPTSALDAAAASLLVELLREWLAGGPRSVIVVSHDDQILRSLQSRRLDVREGQLREALP